MILRELLKCINLATQPIELRTGAERFDAHVVFDSRKDGTDVPAHLAEMDVSHIWAKDYELCDDDEEPPLEIDLIGDFDEKDGLTNQSEETFYESSGTLTFSQLKKLVMEGSGGGGKDGKFHAKDLRPYGFTEDKSVDVYDLKNHKARFYTADGGRTGIVYSRSGSVTTLIPYSVQRGINTDDRKHAISGDYNEITKQLDGLLKYIRKIA